MSSPLRKYNTRNYGVPLEYDHSYCDEYVQNPISRKRRLVKTKKRPNFLLRTLCFFSAVSLLGAYGYYVCPYVFQKYFKPLCLNRILNRDISFDLIDYMQPTRHYLSNSFLLDKHLMVPHTDKSKALSEIQMISELAETKNKLLELFKKYPRLQPSVFVWEYSTGAGLEINANEVYPSASIIKIPIVFELIRLIDRTQDTVNPVSLSDKRVFSEDYRTLGSGDLQYTKANVGYTLDYLANITIANSDNSATNMLLNEIGGMDGFNRAMRNLGLKITSMGEWLPDMGGLNKITAKEISTILYNIDNPSYINPKYKNLLKEYLGNTKNIHLIKEKLPLDAMVLHKTGDIGDMLGDSGIVYTDNGKKYIVTILVKRPHNDYAAKILIQEASLLIYNDIKTLF